MAVNNSINLYYCLFKIILMKKVMYHNNLNENYIPLIKYLL